MRTLKTRIKFLPVLILATLLAAGSSLGQSFSSNVSVYFSGLNNPRGLKFGPDGKLYVAEAGTGGTNDTLTLCPNLQVGPPAGPYVNGRTARVVRIDGPNLTQVIGGLPSAQSQFPDWQGVAAVAFIGERLFALIQGGGCSYGEATIPKSIIEIDPTNQSYQTIADLSAFYRAHPPAFLDADFEPEGVFYSMVAVLDRAEDDSDHEDAGGQVGGKLYVVEANGTGLYEVTTAGAVRRLVDFGALFGADVVTTALTHHGDFYVGNLSKFPTVDGASTVWKVTPSGQVSVAAQGLTAILGLAFDHQKRMYVLETAAAPGPDIGNGRVVRVYPSGRKDVIATGLTFPTAITYGPDGHLYVSNRGYDIPPGGTGEILKIRIPE